MVGLKSGVWRDVNPAVAINVCSKLTVAQLLCCSSCNAVQIEVQRSEYVRFPGSAVGAVVRSLHFVLLCGIYISIDIDGLWAMSVEGPV